MNQVRVVNPLVAPKHILLIDDDASIRLILQATFECLTSWTVSMASSASEGICKAEAEHPDLILMDYMMPKVNGLGCLNHLRSNPQTKDIPVIFLTAHPTLKESHQFQDVGAVGVVAKPFEPFLLVDYIMQALNWGDSK